MRIVIDFCATLRVVRMQEYGKYRGNKSLKNYFLFYLIFTYFRKEVCSYIFTRKITSKLLPFYIAQVRNFRYLFIYA